MKRIAMTGALLALMLGACTRQVVVGSSSGGAGVAPSLIVEQFMKAANAKDLETMGRLFGTKDGPIANRDDRNAVEKRMFAIATELRHTDYEITGEQMVPGRSELATKVAVRLTKDDRKFNVPFTLVRYKNDSWLVEQIGLEVLTAPRN